MDMGIGQRERGRGILNSGRTLLIQMSWHDCLLKLDSFRHRRNVREANFRYFGLFTFCLIDLQQGCPTARKQHHFCFLETLLQARNSEHNLYNCSFIRPLSTPVIYTNVFSFMPLC